MKTYEHLKYQIHIEIQHIINRCLETERKLAGKRECFSLRMMMVNYRLNIGDKFSVYRTLSPSELQTYSDVEASLMLFKRDIESIAMFANSIPYVVELALIDTIPYIKTKLQAALHIARELREPRPIDLPSGEVDMHVLNATATKAGYQNFRAYLNSTDSWQKSLEEIEKDLEEKAGMFL